MSMFVDTLIIFLHALVAWVLVEVFVNNAYRLSRPQYVFFHYVSVVAAFAIAFFVYFQFFAAGWAVFFVTMTALGFVLLLEIIVFGYLYSGDRWFLNFADWIFPMFLATSTIYLMGVLLAGR
ncbi:hypothetical protein FJZ23_00325 [Candidatus Parcubacteria bacterium]|nr:hypothetical protein [Candidatus Parcubacteria bacterium]